MKKALFIVVGLFVVLNFILSNDVLSWVESTTHRDISEYAVGGSILSKNKGDYLKNIGFEQGPREKFKWGDKELFVNKWLAEGAELEDKTAVLFPALGTSRSVNHFHNPLKPWSIGGLDDTVLLVRYTGESSVLWSQDTGRQQNYPEGDWSWQRIRNYYYLALTSATDSERQENFAKTFRGLGHQMHLIQDGAQPDHVRNNAHPWDTTGLKRWIGIEKWANDNPTFIGSLALDPKSPQVSFNVAYNDLAPISQLFDAFQYLGVNPSNSLNQGMTEYTNANFFSDDTIFSAERYSTNHRHYFPYPKRGSTDLHSYINGTKPPETIISEDGLEDTGFWISKVNDGETVSHFLKAGFLTPVIYKLFGEGELYYRSFYRDEECHKDYARRLIPRAVGYSAGLLKYFFRGQLDFKQTDTKPNGDIEITITNLSDDPLVNGVFELYYDNDKGNRTKVILSQSTVNDISKNGTFKTTFSSPPDIDAQKRNWYMLVYNGQLGGTRESGGEKGAIVGRYKLLARETPVSVTYMPTWWTDEKMIMFDGTDSNYYMDVSSIAPSGVLYEFVRILEADARWGALIWWEPTSAIKVMKFHVTGAVSINRTDIYFEGSLRHIQTAAGNFQTAGFEPGSEIKISGSNSNDGTYTIASIDSPTQVTVVENLIDEGAGASTTISETIVRNKIVGVNAEIDDYIFQPVTYTRLRFDYRIDVIQIPFDELNPPSGYSFSLPSPWVQDSTVRRSYPFTEVIDARIFLSDGTNGIQTLYGNISFDEMKVGLGVQIGWQFDTLFYKPKDDESDPLYASLFWERHYLADYNGSKWTLRDVWHPALVVVYDIVYYQDNGWVWAQGVVLDENGQVAGGGVGAANGYVPLLTEAMTSCDGFMVQWHTVPWWDPVPRQHELRRIYWENYGPLPSDHRVWDLYVFITERNYLNQWRSIPHSEFESDNWYSFGRCAFGGGKISRASANPAMTQNGQPIYFLDGVFYQDTDTVPLSNRFTQELLVAQAVLNLPDVPGVLVEQTPISFCKKATFSYQTEFALVAYGRSGYVDFGYFLGPP